MTSDEMTFLRLCWVLTETRKLTAEIGLTPMADSDRAYLNELAESIVLRAGLMVGSDGH